LLFEVLDLNPVWVRVPVFVGERNEINDKAPALIGSLTGKSNEKRETANRVEAPPSANALAGSVDLFYSLPNRAEQYSPGERVGVTLQLKTEAESLTVPRGAILYDANGGTWVYEAGAEHTYTRRRVQVNHIDGDMAVLATGPPPGTKIVVNGAIELFGTETGYSK
jgi:multidrug efflux pump subunit AcrA (membrane-fusion protein)